jgi:hypothetical protein
VTLGETLALTRSNPDYYALALGNSMLGGAFYSTIVMKSRDRGRFNLLIPVPV